MSEKTAKSYLPKMKKCILTFLRRRFDERETQRMYERIQQLEETYRREEPYIGDKDNMMSDNLYQAYCMFALYEAMDRKLTAEEIQELIDIYFAQAMAHVPKKLDLSILVRAKLCVAAIYKYLEHYAVKANAKKGKEWGNIDHRTIEAFGLKLFRDKTVSNGDAECAYWVVSGKSVEADSFVNEKNPDGLILSRMKLDI